MYTEKEIEQIQCEAYASGIADAANIVAELGMHFEMQSNNWFTNSEGAKDKRTKETAWEIAQRYEEKVRACQQILDRLYPDTHHMIFADHITKEPRIC